MPMLEVVHASPADKALTKEQKGTFSKEASQILREVLGTPPGRLRLYFVEVPWENCIEGIEEEEKKARLITDSLQSSS